MAEIIVDSMSQAPYTPVKGATVQTTEVPDYSPGAVPPYAKDAKAADQSSVFEGQSTGATMFSTGFKPDTGVSMMPPDDQTLHPVLPGGDLYYDIKNHIKCYPIYNNNIETLLAQFVTMKKDLELTRTELAKSQRETRAERDAKEAAERARQIAERELKEAIFDLAETRTQLVEKEVQLVDKEKQLSRAIKQIADLATRLEKARNDLRAITRLKEQLGIELDSKVRELDFYTARTINLEAALQIANTGENAANDRNTRLTQMLFEIEASKASIERVKDEAENRIRFLTTLVDQLERDLRNKGGKDGLIVAELRLQIHSLKKDVQKLETDNRTLHAELVGKDYAIAELKKYNGTLEGDVKHEHAWVKIWRETVDEYDRIITNELPRTWREKFPQVKIAGNDGEINAGDLPVTIAGTNDITTTTNGNVETSAPKEPEVTAPAAGPTEPSLPTEPATTPKPVIPEDETTEPATTKSEDNEPAGADANNSYS